MSLSDPVLLSLPLLTVAAHLCEEFVWPGGFPDWYRRYHPARAASVTSRYLVIVNALLIAIALLPPMLGATPRGLAWWMVVAGIGAANAVFHLWATASRSTYSPGVVTGTLLYLPLAAFGVWWLVLPKRVSPGTALQAAVVGVGYHLWSSWMHRRRSSAAQPAR